MKSTIEVSGINVLNDSFYFSILGDYGYTGMNKAQDLGVDHITDYNDSDFMALIGALVLAGFTVSKVA